RTGLTVPNAGLNDIDLIAICVHKFCSEIAGEPNALAVPTLMESAARQTARAHEHESWSAFARSAPQRRHAKRSGQAPSACSRPDYENNDGECHAEFGVRRHVQQACRRTAEDGRAGCAYGSLGNMQSFRHYVTGPLVPNTGRKYCAALAGVPRLLV